MVVSSDVLERPGRLRAIGTLIPILLVALPSTTLMWSVLQSSASKEGLVSVSYQAALLRSGALALLITVASVLVGLPCGVFSAVYEFRGRRALLALAGLPLLLPSFLNALGWSMLTLRLAPNASAVLSGFPGAFLAHFPEGSALVLFASFGAARGLSQSQLDAARIADGERGALVTTCRYAGVPAILAAILAGVLSLSDPGPSQVFGLRTAASEILTTFSSRYDFAEAGRQCLVLSGVVLLIVIPVAFLAAPRLADEILARQQPRAQRTVHPGIARVAVIALVLVCVVNTALPAIGLCLPAIVDGTSFARAWGELTRTAGNTLLYAAGAGVLATGLGFSLSLFVGRSERLRFVALAALFALLALPSTLAALGLARIAALAPAWADPVLRGRWMVCIALALHLVPVAAFLGLRAWGSSSRSWALAAGLHGVPLVTTLRRIVVPWLLPSATVAILLVALLGTADVGTVLLLHPPGEASLPLALFTVMANAPESLVASLCVVYVAAAALVMLVMWSLLGRRRT